MMHTTHEESVLSHIDTGLNIIKVQVADDVVHSCILKVLGTKVGRGQRVSHSQLELTIGQFSCLKGFLKQGKHTLQTHKTKKH